MNNLSQYITEKLHLNKNIKRYAYTCHPKNKEELNNIINERLKESDILDLTDVDISNLDDDYSLTYLFERRPAKVIDLRGWDLTKQKDIHGLFWYNHTVEEIYVDDWDTSNINNMYGVFYKCNKLKILDISNWNVKNVRTHDLCFDKSPLEHQPNKRPKF